MSYLTAALAEIREKYATDKTDKIDNTPSNASFGTIGNFVTGTDTANSAEWDAADRQADFDERCGILQFDAGLSRTEADRAAMSLLTAEIDYGSIPGTPCHRMSPTD